MLPSRTIEPGGRRAPRVLVVASLVTAVGGAAAMTALAATEGGAPTLRVAHHRVPAGGTVLLRGQGFPRRAHVTLRVRRLHHHLQRVGEARTGLRGGFVAPIKIERGARRGRYVALACHRHCRVRAHVQFRIVRRVVRG